MTTIVTPRFPGEVRFSTGELVTPFPDGQSRYVQLGHATVRRGEETTICSTLERSVQLREFVFLPLPGTKLQHVWALVLMSISIGGDELLKPGYQCPVAIAAELLHVLVPGGEPIRLSFRNPSTRKTPVGLVCGAYAKLTWMTCCSEGD